MKIFFTSLIIGVISFSSYWSTFAKDEVIDKPDLSAFETLSIVSNVDVLVPTVVDIPIYFKSDVNNDVLVVEELEGKPVPASLLVSKEEVDFIAQDFVGGMLPQLTDGNKNNYVEYPVSGNGLTDEVGINFYFEKSISLSSISFQFDNHVALPKTIEVVVVDDSSDDLKVVVAKKEMKSSIVHFPETTGKVFMIKLSYVQPLRIRDVKFGFNKNDFDSVEHLRYLAQPGNNYSIYYNADRYIDFDEGESPDLISNDGVKYLSEFNSRPNSLFMKADIDEDGVFDEIDNCVSVKNSNQEDVNLNGRGDACDDFDRDGVINDKDNCLNKPNNKQQDKDLDGIGDICDDQESRFFQNKSWLPVFSIIIVLIVTGGLIILTVKKKE